jgi:heavy metal translocating P-type ATPase
MANISSCTLCQASVATKAHTAAIDEEIEAVFCCNGCLYVYQILHAQGSLQNFRDHPVYRQALQAGLIANPSFGSEQEKPPVPEADYQKIHLIIDDLWCPSCAYVINLLLMKEPGIRQCVVDYSTDLASIEFTPRIIAKERVIHLIQQMGYHPNPLSDPRQSAVSRSLLLRFIVAAFFSLNIMMFAYPLYATYYDGDPDGYAPLLAWLSCAASMPVLFYSGWPIWKRCFTAFKAGVWGMEALVALGVAAATALSLYELWRQSYYVYFDSMTVIIVFVLLGKVIESKAKFSAKDALLKLTLAMPRRGRKKFPSGEETFIPIREFNIGDLLSVRMGEKIVLDGVVEEGSGACDESLMTGESRPVTKGKGSDVLAGSILQQGSLTVTVTATLEETALQRIIDMVGHDIAHKSDEVRTADRIVRWFVPLVFLLSLATAGICYFNGITDVGQTPLQTAIVRAVSVLLISCPCAIGIAAPLAEAYLLNALAKLGVIVRNRACLKYIGREVHFVFDKTGTVTQGQFKVIQGTEQLTIDDKNALKGLTAFSLHPIALAIHEGLQCTAASFEKIEELVGKGIQGIFNGEWFHLGSKKFLTEAGVALQDFGQSDPETLQSTVYFGRNRQHISTISLGDFLKEGCSEFVSSLNSVKTLLLSGDHPAVVKKVAESCQFDEWMAEQTPLQKKQVIENLKRKGAIVAMLGDGMNDAPPLASAHIGIAVMSASDISIQVSDLLLTSNNFKTISLMRQLAIKGHKILKQNFFWAFFYNVIGIGLAMCGLLSPIFAAIAMVLSSFIVLFNAQRLSK